MLPDMPKVQCPFVRETNSKWEYLVTDKINPWYERVFEDPNVICVEKLDGTNICIEIKNKQVVNIQNRMNVINPRNISTVHIMEWLYESLKKNYLDLKDWIYFGELIWPKLQANPYQIDYHIWLPFATYCKEFLTYKTWHEYPKTFQNISDRFQNNIFSLYYRKRHKWDIKKPEWVMFYHPDGRIAKLRLDMFHRYDGKRHRE